MYMVSYMEANDLSDSDIDMKFSQHPAIPGQAHYFFIDWIGLPSTS